MPYIYERDWPDFNLRDERVAQPLAAVRHREGRLIPSQ
jgi:hypothetical protein